MISDTGFTKSHAMHLLNGWLLVIYFAYSEFFKINTESDDKVALNKAKLKGLNIKKGDFINIKEHPLSLAKK